MEKRTSGTQGRQETAGGGHDIFSQTLWVDFSRINLTFSALSRATFSSPTHCLCEVHLVPLGSSLAPGSVRAHSPARCLLDLIACGCHSKPFLHFPQVPKATQRVIRRTLNRTQLIRRGPISFTSVLPEVVFPLRITPL